MNTHVACLHVVNFSTSILSYAIISGETDIWTFHKKWKPSPICDQNVNSLIFNGVSEKLVDLLGISYWCFWRVRSQEKNECSIHICLTCSKLEKNGRILDASVTSSFPIRSEKSKRFNWKVVSGLLQNWTIYIFGHLRLERGIKE